MDAGEMLVDLGHPGVFDLQAFAAPSPALVVVAFIPPIAGDYVLSELAVRRVASQGDTATFRVFRGTMAKQGAQIGPSLQAKNDQHWVSDSGTYPLMGLTDKDRICFTVDSDGNFDNDATEISWVLTAMAP